MSAKNQLPSDIVDNTILPLIAAPMFLVSGQDMVIACCKKGVMCAFPFPNARTIEDLDSWMDRISNELNETQSANPGEKVAPWVANMIVHSTYPRFDDELALVKKYQPKIVITALGSPERVVEAVHSYGGLVFADVNSVKFAKKASQMGVDGLVLVASGAGGHTGQVSSFAFVDAVREFWDGYIVLAGSISNGTGIRAAQSLGADLAYMGTRFIPIEESMANTDYQKMLIDSTVDDLVLTDAITGVHANFLIPSLQKAGIDFKNAKGAEINFNEQGSNGKKPWRDVWSAGQGVGVINKVQTAAELIDQLLSEYEASVQNEKIGDAWTRRVV